MSNRIRIKRRLKGSSETSLPELYTGELAYDETKGKLYIGESDQLEPTGVPVAIGGSGYIISAIKDIAALKDGVGASGTWNINISGNAATVTNGVYTSRQITPGSGLFGSAFDLSADRTLNVGQGTGIIIDADYVNIDPSYVITSINNQTISGVKTFNSGLLVNTTGLGEFTSVGKDYNGIYVPSGTIRTQNLVVDGNLSVGTSIDISLVAEILAKGTLKYNASKFIFDSGVAIFTSGLYVGPTGSPTGVSLSGHKHVYTDITNFCTGVATCVNTPLLGGSGLVLNYSDPNLSIDIGQGYGIIVNSDTISVDSNSVVMITGDQNISGNKTFNNGSISDVKIQTNINGTGTLYFIDGGSHISYIKWDGTNHNLVFDSNLSVATTDFKKTIRYQAPTTGTAATSVPVFTGSTNPSSSVQTIAARSLSDFKSDLNLNNVTNDAQVKKLDSSTQGYIPVWSGTSGDQLGYGYNVSSDLSTNSDSSYIPRADAVKTYVDNQVNNTNTIVRTTGNQNISGSKVFFNTSTFNSGLTASGINSLQVSSSSSVATQFVIFTGDPSSAAKQLYTRTPSEVKSDIGLSNLTNNVQIKQTTASTVVGYIPTWNSTSGESLGTGYIVETSLTGSSLALPRADAVKTYVDNQLNNVETIVRTTGNQTISGIKTFDSNTIFLQDLLIVGNLAVSGNTITANVDTMTIEDPILTLGLASGNMIVSDTMDRGLALVRGTNLTAFMGWDSSDNEFVMLSSGIASNNSGNYSAGSYGDLRINNLTANSGSFSGNIGIGTTAPRSQLHVVGSGFFTSGLSVSGLLTTNSGNFINSLLVNGTGVWHSGNFDAFNIVRTTGYQDISGQKFFSDGIIVNTIDADGGAVSIINGSFTMNGGGSFSVDSSDYISITSFTDYINKYESNENTSSYSIIDASQNNKTQVLINSGNIYFNEDITSSGNIKINNQTANTIAKFDANKNITSLSSPSLTELGYISGVTGNIQTQINSKQNTLTNPVTGTGTGSSTVGYISRWISSSGVANSTIYQSGNNVGIGITNPSYNLQLAGDLKASILYGDAVYIGNSIFAATDEAFITINSNSNIWVVDTEMGSFNFGNLITANVGANSVTINGITNTTIDCGTF